MAACSRCGAALIGSGKFCAACGAPIATSAQPATRVAPTDARDSTTSAKGSGPSISVKATGSSSDEAVDPYAATASPFSQLPAQRGATGARASAPGAAGSSGRPTGGSTLAGPGAPLPNAPPPAAAVPPLAEADRVPGGGGTPAPWGGTVASPRAVAPPVAVAAAPAPVPRYAPPAPPPVAPVAPAAPAYAAPPPIRFGVGARVLVQWADGNRYPGTVQQTTEGQCLVVFQDGQQRWVAHAYLSFGY